MSNTKLAVNNLRIGYSFTFGGFINVSSIEEAEALEEKIKNNDFELFENRMVHTHFEGLSWDES